MNELLKQIIAEIFPSEDMKTYLSENIDKLWRYQVLNMISGAMVPLKRKLVMFEALEIEEQKCGNYFAEKDDLFRDKDLIQTFGQFAEGIKRAVEELEISTKENGILLMQEKQLIDGEDCIIGDLPFFSYEKFLSYMKEYQQNREEGLEYDWHKVEKYQEDEKGNLEETHEYIFVNGELFFYSNLTDDEFDCWPDDNLNLPVPFKAGDIILVEPMPFSVRKKGLILDIGDNSDCCCVQVMHKNERGWIDTAALKHSSMFYSNMSYPSVSALYTAHIYDGELEEDETFLAVGKEFISDSKMRGSQLWDCLPILEEDFCMETIKRCVNKR